MLDFVGNLFNCNCNSNIQSSNNNFSGTSTEIKQTEISKQCAIIPFPSLESKTIQHTEKLLTQSLNKYIRKTPRKSLDDSSEVYPFKKTEDIISIQKYLLKIAKEKNTQAAYRNLLAFQLGINLGLRASDLLALTFNQIFDKNGNFINTDDNWIIELKTNKSRLLVLNQSCQEAIKFYLEKTGVKPILSDTIPNEKNFKNYYVFYSQKAHEDEYGNMVKHLTTRSYGEILKKVAKKCNIMFNVNTHSMRKTWCYNIIKNNLDNAFILATVSKLLNHSSLSITYRYCGLDQEMQKNVYFSNSIPVVTE